MLYLARKISKFSSEHYSLLEMGNYMKCDMFGLHLAVGEVAWRREDWSGRSG